MLKEADVTVSNFEKFPLPESTVEELFPRELLALMPAEYPYSVLVVARRVSRWGAFPPKQSTERAAQITQAHAVYMHLHRRHSPHLSNNAKPATHNHVQMFADVKDAWAKAYDEAETYRLSRESERMQETLDALETEQTVTLSEVELRDLQDKINALQESVTTAGVLSGRDKDRMLRTIRRLNQQLHSAITSFAGYYGLIDEYLMLGKMYAERARPILDCIKIIVETVSKIQQVACGLPSGSPSPIPKLTAPK